MSNDVINQDTRASLEYCQLMKDESTFPVWNRVAANECGSMFQGVVWRIEGPSTIFFIPRQAIPKGKIVSYGRFVVCAGHPSQKTETQRGRLAMGGNLIQYPVDVLTR
jgi:hypothetical protein